MANCWFKGCSKSFATCRCKQFLLSLLQCLLLKLTLLFKLELAKLFLVFFYAFIGDAKKVLFHFNLVTFRIFSFANSTLNLVDEAVITSRFNRSLSLTILKQDRFRDVYWATFVGAFLLACKFLYKPAISLFLKVEMIAFLKLDLTSVFDSFHLPHYVFLQIVITWLLIADSLLILFSLPHLLLLHSSVASWLLAHEFVLFGLLLNEIFDPWIKAIRL